MDTIIGTSSIADLSSSIDWENAPSLRADFKTANFTLDELYPWLMSFNGIQENIQDVQSVQGTVTFQNLKVEGPLFRPQNWRPQTQGVVENAIVKLKKLQKPLHLTHGKFSWNGSRIIFTDFDATLGNSSVLQASGDLNWGTQPKFNTQSGPAIFDLEDITPWLFSFGNFNNIFKKYEPLTGILAFQHMALSCPISSEAYRQLKLSADIQNLTIHAKRLPGPLRLNKGQFSWQNTQLTLNNIDAALGNSTISQLSADFNWGTASTLDVHSESMQLFAGEIYPWLLSFEILQPILREFSASDGILGLQDLNLNGPLHHPADWEYRLTCQMQHLVVTSEVFGAPVTVTNGQFEISNEMTSGAVENKIIVGPTNIAWEKNLLTMMGEIWASNRNVLLSLDVAADGIDWKQIKNILDYIEKKNTAPNKLKWDGFLQGSINVQSDKFNYDAYRVQPLQAKVSFDHDKVMIAVDKAVICNISFRGLVKIQAQALEIYFVPTVADQELGSTLTCITDKKDLATGIYDLSGELMAKSKPEEFPRSLSGNVVFTAETGRIYRFGLLAKIFAILNVTEVYRGEIPDLTGAGFAYHSMKARAKLQGGKIIMEECAIDGASMGIACEGDIDIADKKMNLVVLVAPFKTVDRIVKKIPLISGILGGKLISIPFSAKGDLKDPQVRPLPPTAVGSGVLGILERTLKLPITIIQPLLSGGNNEKQK
jgi:hypothetical protein